MDSEQLIVPQYVGQKVSLWRCSPEITDKQAHSGREEKEIV